MPASSESQAHGAAGSGVAGSGALVLTAGSSAANAEYAAALLLKLDHLASSQRVHAIDSSQTQTYLAPWLALPAQSLLDAA